MLKPASRFAVRIFIVFTFLSVFNFAACLTHAQATAPALSGDYAGTLGSLHLVLHLERDPTGHLTGSMDSPDQGALGIPCDGFHLSGAAFSFAVPAVHGAYTGTVSLDAKTITGTWNQGAAMPLVLTKTAAAAPAFVPADKPSRIDGDWSGAIDTPAGKLPAVIHVKSDRAGKEYLAFDSPTQNAFGLPGDKVTIKGNQFSFDLPIVHGHYDGTLSADGNAIAGTWNQGAPLPLNFTRTAPFVAAEKPSTVDGDWSGLLETKNGSLHAAIHVRSDKAGQEYVTLDSPDQDAMNLSGADARLSATNFSFQVPQLHGSYSGKISANGSSIEGVWTQGAAIPLRFNKSAENAVKPVAPAPTQAAPLSLSDLQTKLDNELKPLIDIPFLSGSTGIGVAVGIYNHGERKILTYGVAKEDSLFEIGSITKTFTGLILSQMVTGKIVALDTPIRELLPPGTVTKPAGAEITLLSLATHHSGMERMPDNFHPADPTNPYADYTEKNLYAYIGKTGVALKPDAKFAYSNVGMGLLGEALANKAGESYSELLRQDVLQPLHMDHTYIALPAAEQARFLAGHNANDQAVHAWDLDAMAPAGGIRSDVRDMLKYVEAQIHPPAGKMAEAIAFEHQLRADTDNGKIAINWMFETSAANYNHGGATGGYTSFAFFNLERDIAAVVLVNRASGLADSLGMRIAELLEGQPAYPLRR